METRNKVIFKNQPLLSEHEVDVKFNERRAALVNEVENFISNHPKFRGEDVTVNFSEKGLSSLVCMIEKRGEKFVLKIPLSLSDSGSEPEFLAVWEKEGVKVPHIFESGKIGEHSYSLMEYIDAPVLGAAYSDQEMREKKIYLEMGKVLRIMHSPKARGYGKLVDGKAEFEKFDEWINSRSMKKEYSILKKII